jgi:hypothetical protein
MGPENVMAAPLPRALPVTLSIPDTLPSATPGWEDVCVNVKLNEPLATCRKMSAGGTRKLPPGCTAVNMKVVP